MKKEQKLEQINICIGKCFAKECLNDDDIKCMEGMLQTDLTDNHGLNIDQADYVMRWIKNECQRMEAQKSFQAVELEEE